MKITRCWRLSLPNSNTCKRILLSAVFGFAPVIVVALAAQASIAADMDDRILDACETSETAQPISLNESIITALANEPHIIIAQQDVAEAKADVKAAVSPFLPKAQLIADEERFVPHNGFAPVTVVGSNILGGTRSYSAYGSIGLSWNISDSGRDVAGLKAAKAEVRATRASLYKELDDSLSDVLKAYADLYETYTTVEQQSASLLLLKRIEHRAEERYQHGNGTTIAIGQARAASLDARKALNESCKTLSEKSSLLSKAMGVRAEPYHVYLATALLPVPPAQNIADYTMDRAIETDPAVEAAKEKTEAAAQKLRQARRAFGPSISLDARRDYLGQNVESFSVANNRLAPNSYRYGISIIQPILPFTTESSAIDKARAEVRRAKALTDQTRLETDSKLRVAASASAEVGSSYREAQISLREAEAVLTLTESLIKAGRTDLDNLEHAQIDVQKIRAEVQTLGSQRTLADWNLARAFEATKFPATLFARLGIAVDESALE